MTQPHFSRRHLIGVELSRQAIPAHSADALCVIEGHAITTQAERSIVTFNESMFSKHLLFIGEIGSGKTNAIQQFLQQIRKKITNNDVVFVFDTKGDFRKEFWRTSDITMSNDHLSGDEHGPNYWNIFNEINDRTYEDDIYEITRSLFFERSKQSNQPFFPNAARDLFAAVMLHYYRLHKRAPLVKPPDNKLLKEFFDSATPDTFREILNLPENSDLRALISYIGTTGTSDQSLGVLSELQQMVREIFIGNFKKSGSLSARQLVRNKNAKFVFIEYDISVGNVLTPIYRLILDFAIKEALSRTRSDGNVWFVIDEFRLIPHLQHIDNGVNFGRSLGAKFIIGIQNVAQIYEAYGESLAKSLLSGFLTTIAFRVNDASSREFIKQLYGKRRIQENTATPIGNQALQSQNIDVDVVEDFHILNLRLGQAIIGLPQSQPFLFQFNAYQRERTSE